MKELVYQKWKQLEEHVLLVAKGWLIKEQKVQFSQSETVQWRRV